MSLGRQCRAPGTTAAGSAGTRAGQRQAARKGTEGTRAGQRAGQAVEKNRAPRGRARRYRTARHDHGRQRTAPDTRPARPRQGHGKAPGTTTAGSAGQRMTRGRTQGARQALRQARVGRLHDHGRQAADSLAARDATRRAAPGTRRATRGPGGVARGAHGQDDLSRPLQIFLQDVSWWSSSRSIPPRPPAGTPKGTHRGTRQGRGRTPNAGTGEPAGVGRGVVIAATAYITPCSPFNWTPCFLSGGR